MLLLGLENNVIDTDQISKQCHYSVLRCKDKDNTDFFFELMPQVEEFTSCKIEITIGEKYVVGMPFQWSILCSDGDILESMPIPEFFGRQFSAFCLNPIDGGTPSYLDLELGEITGGQWERDMPTWSSPVVADKEFLVVPIGFDSMRPNKGPICAMFTPHKIDIKRTVGDIIL